jgi:hypothetical protein
MDNYKPVRVLKKITVSAISEDELKRKFPHTQKAFRIKSAPRTMAQSAFYTPGQVIDAPTADERQLFDLFKGIAAVIKQHRDGYDDPRTNLARSREGSHKGRQKFIKEIAAQKPIEPVKIEPEVKSEPVVERDYEKTKSGFKRISEDKDNE